ncbi:TPA: site-specific integrase [Escherichia coli]|uniref:site-specific integrase n=1 Tax=Citrobacter koseri TaxID=545 RepID=UPI0017F79BAC|nr:site-specific integrase [Citrobacter koseri]MBS8530485.1 site-specific integrase [Escherichia coli]MBJ8805212.1 site-specific integrase [Citrobacter koseri]HAJ5612113.1 site-specific integrase [Escherichia coli]HAX7556393.1 site-specific integrase [Escherichia coli]HBC6675696.1 site-specific integrase [Escherichia coli]
MAQRDNLYRRSSGIYVVRIAVPARYRLYTGQREIHASTETNDIRKARAIAAGLLVVWQRCLGEYQKLDREKLVSSAPVLAGEGMISLAEFCGLTSASLQQVAQRLLDTNIPLFWLADGRPAYYVEDLSLVDKDDPEASGFIIDSAINIGIRGSLNGYIQPLVTSRILRQIIAGESLDAETAFKSSEASSKAVWFVDFPGVEISPSSLMIHRVQAERLRLFWLSYSTAISPVLPEKPKAITPVLLPSSIPDNEYVNRKYYSVKMSELCEKYIRYKRGGKFTEKAENRVREGFGLLLEVMGDSTLEKVDRDFLRKYESLLRSIPARRDLAKIRYKINDLNGLIVKAKESGDPLMSDNAVRKYMRILFEVFQWADGEGIFIKSPANKFFAPVENEKMDQDFKSDFTDEDLNSIFGMPWYKRGTVDKNRQGQFHHYRAFHYWLPLIGFFTGARINELCQLYLDDIKQDAAGFYFFEISNERADQSLKTIHSRRKMPLHPTLIKLGLVRYCEALKKAGHERLFPELPYHPVKGYGDKASDWFNRSLLKERLGFEKDSKKSFHSFRHTFSTRLKQAGIDSETRAQFVGHIRGSGETENRYSKDHQPAALYAVLESATLGLPEVAPFVCEDGVVAVADALRIKQNNKSRKEPQ